MLGFLSSVSDIGPVMLRRRPPDVAKVSVVKAYGATIQVLGFSGRVCALISQRADIS